MKNSVKTVLLLLFLTNLVYVFMLVVTIPEVMLFSEGMTLPDMMPTGYDTRYVSDLFSSLGRHGREAYLCGQIPVDMIYPFLFAISYSWLLAIIVSKLGKATSAWNYCCLFPLLAGFFDYCENAGIITMLNTYPINADILVSTTNIFTILKSVFTTLGFLSLIVFSITLAVYRLRFNSFGFFGFKCKIPRQKWAVGDCKNQK